MSYYSFKNDYSEGAHINIINALSESNYIQDDGYGLDDFCKSAIEIICKKINNPNADIHFISGGTQANLIAISSFLKPYESVISASTAHIAVHETGAIECTGHKINVVDTKDGKLKPDDIKNVLDYHTDEHMVKPKLVFISNSTELGSIYLKKELQELSKFCKQNNLLLYCDGARLGAALTSPKNDLTLKDISELVDAFYIGGTKNGALFGEALVITNNSLIENFRFNLKQKGALLAKSRIMGIQFLELFKDDLFYDLAKHANNMAMKMAKGIKKKGYKFLLEPSTNQIFPILPDSVIDNLKNKYGFYVWSKYNKSNSVLRLVTSWNTDENFIDSFLNDLE